MADPELKAITVISEALAELSDEQRSNVLTYVNARYAGQLAGKRSMTLGPAAQEAAVDSYQNIGDFFDAVDPHTEAERVLAVSYWLQANEGLEEFESYPVNKHLKNLSHSVSNITRALDSLIAQSPRLVIQTSKSGRSKQARKTYKLTREGIKRVQAMHNRSGGEDDDK